MNEFVDFRDVLNSHFQLFFCACVKITLILCMVKCAIEKMKLDCILNYRINEYKANLYCFNSFQSEGIV